MQVKSNGSSKSSKSSKSSRSSTSSHSAAATAPTVDESGDDDDVEVTGEKTWAERDKELRAQAVELD